MTEKKTSNMLIRYVPMDVWERIDRLCRRQGIKRREFIEQALAALEAAHGEGSPNGKAKKVRADMERLAQIKEELSAYQGAIKFKKSINKVLEDIEIMPSIKDEMNVFLELQKMGEDLDRIISDYIPKHEIPEDPEKRSKMGLPQDYWWDYEDIPVTYKRDMDGPPVSTNLKNDLDKIDDRQTAEHFQKIMDDVKRKMARKKAAEVDPLQENESVNDKTNNYSDSNDKNTEKVKTTSFGRGFDNFKTTSFGRGFDNFDNE